MRRPARRWLLAALCGLCLLAPSPAEEAEEEGEEVEACEEMGERTKDRKIRNYLRRHKPLRLRMQAAMGEAAAGRHWDLFGKEDCFHLAISPDGTFFGPVLDEASPLGLRRVAPALLDCVPWATLRELMELLAKQPSETKQSLPRHLRTAQFPNYNDVLEEGSISLASALQPGRGLYVDGQPSAALEAALGGPLLANLTERLAKVMKQRPHSSSLWLSGGRLVEKLHYYSTDSWLCQLAGRQDITFVSHTDLEKIYPVSFAEPGAAIDFQLLLRPDGQLVEEPVPDEYRDGQSHLAAVDLDEPDYARFPKFVNATRMSCQLEAGECVWVPSFWWRRSLPSVEDGPSMAISLGFDSQQIEGKSFDRTAAAFGLESSSRVTETQLRARARHTEL